MLTKDVSSYWEESELLHTKIDLRDQHFCLRSIIQSTNRVEKYGLATTKPMEQAGVDRTDFEVKVVQRR